MRRRWMIMIETAMFQSKDIQELEQAINDFFAAALYVDRETIIDCIQSQDNNCVTFTILYEKPT